MHVGRIKDFFFHPGFVGGVTAPPGRSAPCTLAYYPETILANLPPHSTSFLKFPPGSTTMLTCWRCLGEKRQDGRGAGEAGGEITRRTMEERC